MQKIIFLIKATLPKKFTRKQYNQIIRNYSATAHPEHYLQRLVEQGKLKRTGAASYMIA